MGILIFFVFDNNKHSHQMEQWENLDYLQQNEIKIWTFQMSY